jgi:hypothetical protein
VLAWVCTTLPLSAACGGSSPGGNLVWNMNRLVSTGYTSLPGETDLLWHMTIG